jgi:hypothetical protein
MSFKYTEQPWFTDVACRDSIINADEIHLNEYLKGIYIKETVPYIFCNCLISAKHKLVIHADKNVIRNERVYSFMGISTSYFQAHRSIIFNYRNHNRFVLAESVLHANTIVLSMQIHNYDGINIRDHSYDSWIDIGADARIFGNVFSCKKMVISLTYFDFLKSQEAMQEVTDLAYALIVDYNVLKTNNLLIITHYYSNRNYTLKCDRRKFKIAHPDRNPWIRNEVDYLD